MDIQNLHVDVTYQNTTFDEVYLHIEYQFFLDHRLKTPSIQKWMLELFFVYSGDK